jgi:aspartyl-tRNA(Asn)/glutamyl-tRNA(Gln) amidotransferase subunit B
MSSWEVVIGIETHAQLTTASKIFSGIVDCVRRRTQFAGKRDRPGAARHAARAQPWSGGARDQIRACHWRRGCRAQRLRPQELLLPDLPKGYQISQYEIPVVQGGSVSFIVPATAGESYLKTVRITRAHLEEDAGKSLHEDGGAAAGMSAIDLNRAGVPLLEIVTEPDLRSAAEAVAYARTLHALVVWLDVCDGNMQEGSFRCDANVSIRPAGSTTLGTRCEIKNLNSFRFLERAIDFEVRRQIELIEDGGTVVQETRLYDAARDETRSMRSKEDAMDYRYFPDPDLIAAGDCNPTGCARWPVRCQSCPARCANASCATMR